MTYSMKTALSAICNVHMGYTVRSGLKAAPEGGIRAIQLRDLHGRKMEKAPGAGYGRQSRQGPCSGGCARAAQFMH
jgi:hypothetical protein